MSTINSKELLLQEINVLPSVYVSEVLDFIDVLKTRRQVPVSETMLLSEAALAKGWDTDEEDKAWANL